MKPRWMVLFFGLFFFGAHLTEAQTRKTPVTKKPVAAPVKTIEPVKPVKPMDRPVTITLKEGEPVSGKFVNATSEGVQIVVAGNSLLLKWVDIAKIVFIDVISAAPTAMVSKNADASTNALKALRKLAAATEVGVNFQTYSGRVIDVKTELNELLPDISEGYVKNEIILAMAAYTDAGTLWNGYIQNKYFVITADKALFSKHGLDMTKDVACVVESSCVLSKIWGIARKHLENASKGNPEEK